MKKITALTAAGILLITGCAGSGPIAAEVNGHKITKAEVKFYQDNYSSMLDSSEGRTEGALQYAIDDQIILALSDKTDMKLDEEDEERVKSTVISFRRSRGGTSKFAQYVKDTGISEDFVKDAMKAMVLREKLKEETAASVSDEDKKQYYMDHYYRAKHILISTSNAETGEEYDEEQLAAAKEKAEDILKRAQEGEDFDTLMNEYTEDPGSETNPDGYIFTDGEMVPEFEDAVKGLEIGQITMCESDYGYHIIIRLALDETPEIFDEGYENVESAIEESLSDESFSDALKGLAEENNIKVKENNKNVEKIVEDLTSATPYPTPTSTSQAR